MASFSSRGPGFTGYAKPDVLAPGLAGYSTVPWYYLYYEGWLGGPYGDDFVAGENTTLFSGTSQAAPIAAGVAALTMEALGWTTGDDPFVVKAILQHTADDLGYDAAIQGFGRVNAEAACDFADGTTGTIGATTDSMYNFAQFMGDAWAYWGILPGGYVPRDVNSTATAFPMANYDGSIFFGQVMPGETATVTYSVYTDVGDVFGTPDTADYTGSTAELLNMTEIFTFSDTTFSYNDTHLVGEQMYGYFNISEAIPDANYTYIMSTADMIQIVVSFDAADVAGAEPWMFLYDWDDVSGDGMPNLYNITSGDGTYDELHRLTSASDASNVNLMQWVPESLAGDLTLVIHDPAHDVATDWWNVTLGNDFDVTIICYTEQTDDRISFADEGTATGSVNITVTVPAGADPGIHTGFANIGPLYVPYSYVVVFNITDDGGDVNTLFSDYGNTLAPYDNVLYGAMDEDPDDWDFRSYVLYNPYATAGYLGIRAEFADAGNDLYIEVYDCENSVIGAGGALTATSTAVIAELDGAGYYYLLVHPLALNGTIAQPVEFTLEAMLYDSLTDQPAVWSYTSDDRTHVTPVAENDTLWGDHVVLNASYPAFNLPNMPEYEITSTTLGFLSGVYHQESGPNVVPSASYDPFSGPVDLTQFAWNRVDGIGEGDNVDIEVDFTNGDCDIMVWWADTDNTTWSYGNNLVGDAMATGAHPEVGSFTADRAGSIMVGIFNYDLTPDSTWTVTVDTRVGVYETATGAEVTYDTYDLGRNGTFQVQLTATTATNIDFEINLLALTFNNYFKPYINSVDVTGSGAVKTITWTMSDLNAGDTHTYEVLLSADGGDTFQLIATGLTALTYDWDSTGFTIRNYVTKVRVTDSYGLDDEMDSTAFEAGTVTVEPEPTTTPEPTPTGGLFGDIDPLWIGLIGGIGVGVVVILILFLVRKR
jgi:hypothetical protein